MFGHYAVCLHILSHHLLTNSTWPQLTRLWAVRAAYAVFPVIFWWRIVTWPCSVMRSSSTFRVTVAPWWPAAPVTVNWCWKTNVTYFNFSLLNEPFWSTRVEVQTLALGSSNGDINGERRILDETSSKLQVSIEQGFARLWSYQKAVIQTDLQKSVILFGTCYMAILSSRPILCLTSPLNSPYCVRPQE